MNGVPARRAELGRLWAVGEYFFFKGQRSYTRRLILHWDGTAWTRVQ